MTSQQREELRSLVLDLAASAAPLTPASNGLPALWSLIADAELDRVAVPESAGGAGGTLGDLVAVVEAVGEAAVSAPVIEVPTARWLLAHDATIAPALLPVVVTTDGDVSLQSLLVPWGRFSDLVLVLTTGEPPRSFRVEPGRHVVASQVNLAGEPIDVLDLSGADSTAIIAAPAPDAIIARLALLWSAAVIGTCRGAYMRTRTHVRTREQFGAPLLKLPAVASALASLRAELVLAEAAVAQALPRDESADHPDLVAASAARVMTSRCATVTARVAHQLHGAMGITEEAGLHRFSTRLWAWQDAVASEREWAVRLAESALDGAEPWVWDRLTAGQPS